MEKRNHQHHHHHHRPVGPRKSIWIAELIALGMLFGILGVTILRAG